MLDNSEMLSIILAILSRGVTGGRHVGTGTRGEKHTASESGDHFLIGYNADSVRLNFQLRTLVLAVNLK
jgi:hypothetical protein